MRYYPEITKHNNRYRGPVESIKFNAQHLDILHNLDVLKMAVSDLESDLEHINNSLKSEDIYKEIKHNLTINQNTITKHKKMVNNY